MLRFKKIFLLNRVFELSSTQVQFKSIDFILHQSIVVFIAKTTVQKTFICYLKVTEWQYFMCSGTKGPKGAWHLTLAHSQQYRAVSTYGTDTVGPRRPRLCFANGERVIHHLYIIFNSSSVSR